jgi:phospholipid transport system substrate-binding protein
MKLAAGIILFLQVSGHQQFADGTPAAQVRNTINRVLSIVREHPAAETQQLEAVIGSGFNFAAMARSSLGPYWRDLKPSQQKEFVAVFTQLLKKTYLKEIKAYDNQRVVVTGERRDGNYAVVNTRIIPKDGEPTSVDYNLQLHGDQWKIYDLVIENVSLVNNYRSQFNHVLVNASYEELLRRMKNKEQGS